MNSISINAKNSLELIGLLPSGGEASRIAPIPCSKEIYPVGFRQEDRGSSVRPKVVSHYLLEKMRIVGVNKAFIILRKDKWDIPAYFGAGEIVDIDIGYLILRYPFGVPFTLDQAYPFVKNAIIVFGFPDIIFQPNDAFVRLIKKQSESNADIVLGLFKAQQPHKMDMVEISGGGQVREIVIKPFKTTLKYTWIIAVWTPNFTRFLHKYVLKQLETIQKNDYTFNSDRKKEVYLGDVIRSAIYSRLKVDHIVFDSGFYVDIGTPEDLLEATKLHI